MARSTIDATIAVQMNDIGKHCHVLVTWPDGRTIRVGDFKTNGEAQLWIDGKAQDWLAGLPR